MTCFQHYYPTDRKFWEEVFTALKVDKKVGEVFLDNRRLLTDAVFSLYQQTLFDSDFATALTKF